MTTTLDTGDRKVGDLIEDTRAVVDPVLRGAVGALPGTMRRIGGYHLGWWDRNGLPEAGRPGKAIRPALVLAAARAVAFGAHPVASAGAAVPAAAAVELVHNYSLLHDDVFDNDVLRRHRPTAWTVFGSSEAILAGDAMQALAFAVLAGDGNPAAAAATARLAVCSIELCEGQSADIAFEGRADVDLNECLAMAEAKTCALLGCACALGGLYAGAEHEVLEALDDFGRQIGLAFQLIDDLLGIWGDPEVTGKPVGSDLTALKKSLPVVAALTSGTAAGAELGALYGAGRPLLGGAVDRAADLVQRAGGRDWARAQAEDRISGALGHLASVFPEQRRTEELLSLAAVFTRRVR